MHRRLTILAAGLLAAGLAAPTYALGRTPTDSSSPARSRPSKALDILLTNDDGWRGDGGADTPLIVALRDALEAAGHNVTVVAPGTDQSGQGGRFSLPPLELEVANPEPEVWTVTPGSPADSVYFAMDEVFAGNPPDLVISGMNVGNNTSTGVNHSGTVQGAMSALELDVPAMAVSLGSSAEWPDGDEKIADNAASYVVELVDELRDSAHRDQLMPADMALNVNYPLIPGPIDPETGAPSDALPPRGTKVTTLGTSRLFALDYTNTDAQDGEPGTYTIGFSQPSDDVDRGSDQWAIEAGYVSVTPLDADYDLDRHTERWVRRLVRRLG